MIELEILGEVISKKNSMIAFLMGKRCSIRPSNKHTAYQKQAVEQLKYKEKWEGSYPVVVETFFYRTTKRKFDFDNMQATINDALVKAGIIEDDSMNHVIPKVSGFGWDVDKENPRAVVKIYPLTPDEACRRSGV